tara:strand:+ start:170 stop:607 length:438 start_codon:yes stop_codon:yes gene_type:complete
MLSQTNAIRNGLLIFGLVGVYFIILEFLGLTDNIFLKFINFLFVLIGVNNTLSAASKASASYLKKLVAGVATVFVGILLSAIALLIYLNVNETADISAYAMTLIPAESNLEFAGVIFVEGFTSSLMIVFIMLQYYKNVNSPAKNH